MEKENQDCDATTQWFKITVQIVRRGDKMNIRRFDYKQYQSKKQKTVLSWEL